MRPEEIRKLIIIALVSSDQLFDRLVLKGGNALALVHRIGDRASLDIDFSMEGDFESSNIAGTQIKKALSDEFARHELTVFDFRCSPKPGRRPPSLPEWWGGYLVEFKLIHSELYRKLGVEGSRRQSIEDSAGLNPRRTFKIDISKFEHTDGKTEAEIDDFSVYVYTPAMIACEKLRAICQQMPDYALIENRRQRARPRDFYDIHSICSSTGFDLSSAENTTLLEEIFRAKDVPIGFLNDIDTKETREFHSTEWASVETSASPEHPFEYYFDFVAKLVRSYSPRGT